MKTTKNTGEPSLTECALPTASDLNQVTIVELQPDNPMANYQDAMQLANAEDRTLLSFANGSRMGICLPW